MRAKQAEVSLVRTKAGIIRWIGRRPVEGQDLLFTAGNGGRRTADEENGDRLRFHYFPGKIVKA
jgi:hypothetical protein